MATNETYTSNQLYSIPLADLQPDPNQPRKYLDPAALDESELGSDQVKWMIL
ncbi:MAG: hypothetical protein PHN75_09890 [Syntrophales bacterium]|nr:hypothetical protein [Syntrophales bacterium]